MLLRNLFASDWPYDVDLLGALTVAVARDADLVEEIAELTDLSDRAIRRRLNGKRGNMLVSNAFPEMSESDTDEDQYLDEDGFEDEAFTLRYAAEIDLLGAARVVSARAAPITRWLANQLDWPETRMRRRLQRTHGKTLLRNALSEHWPFHLGPGTVEMLGSMRVASLRRSPSLVLWLARLLRTDFTVTAHIIETATGNALTRNLFSQFAALPTTSASTEGATVVAPPRSAQRHTAMATRTTTPQEAIKTIGPGVLVKNRWRILGHIGEQGGFGAVFEVRDERHPESKCVMKVAEGASAEARRINRERLHSEVKIAHRLTHQNICAYLSDEHDDQLSIYYAIMKHAGVSLESLIRSGNVGLDDALDIVMQVAKGLDYAHRREIVHQDLKPANILVQGTGRHREARIGDWGIAGQGRVNLTERMAIPRL